MQSKDSFLSACLFPEFFDLEVYLLKPQKNNKASDPHQVQELVKDL